MQAVAHNPKFAKKVGVPTSVGKEFTKNVVVRLKRWLAVVWLLVTRLLTALLKKARLIPRLPKWLRADGTAK